MKILLVDHRPESYEKWIAPLRQQGWGVVRAQSTAEAKKLMSFHGSAVEGFVLNEEFVGFAESYDLPFVVLTDRWTDQDILKHQNSERSALSYVGQSGSAQELVHAFTRPPESLKATGTDSEPVARTQSIALEDFSQVMSRPEQTRTAMTESSILLNAPSVLLGGKAVDAIRSKEKEIEEESPSSKTLILDSTQLQDMGLELEAPPLMDEEADLAVEAMFEPAPGPAPVPEANHGDYPSVDFSPSASTSDVETLKSYLALREQDVTVLAGQLRSAHERVKELEAVIKVERSKNLEQQRTIQKQDQTLKSYDLEKKVELEVLYAQTEDLNGQLKERNDKVRTIETQLKVTAEEVDRVKEKVRVDVRRIRVREKELENQLEVLKKDSAALLIARDEKILELKRKLDLMEFNMELIQEQYHKERNASESLRNRLKDAAQVMRQAGGFLES